MTQTYVHLSGQSSKVLLQKNGIITLEDNNSSNCLKSKQCPNCNESNRQDSKFCIKCRMVLTYDSYNEVRNEDKNKIEKLESDIYTLKEDMETKFQLIISRINVSKL
ncbi:MAG: zinc ribbon domain-containing protein [Thermoproteota archaeon]|nr:zinc ribbon domain-containing protein [Thermoproteota archaeon]